MYRVPRATYRLQFNSGFTFADARGVVAYLAELGISDIYASPILRARRGSSHGYDVVDASALNPELGSDDDFNALHAELQQRQLGLLLDVVPNHMAASSENAWWMSVLENGEHSRFLHYFDIDWTPITTRGQTVTKVLLPILGKPYGEALESQEIQLHFDVDGFFFTYYDKRLPLAPGSYGQILRQCVEALPGEGVAIELRELLEDDAAVPNSRFLKETLWRIYEQDETFREALHAAIQRINSDADALDALLDAQWYRLAYWRIASEKINYRRFFDVTDLVGVRVENPEVFEARNRRTLELIAEGKVTGLRIDHIDGLHDPIGHMRKLQLRLGGEPAGDDRFYIVVEKILEPGEELPRDFPVSGTTGYDFLDAVNALFVDPEGLQHLDRFYRNFTGITESFDDISYERKKQVIHELFSGEMRALGKQLSAVAMSDRNARDFAPVDLTAALTEVTACLRVYRSYVREGSIAAADENSIRRAIAEARGRAGSGVDERLFNFLERVLQVDPPSHIAAEREHWLAFVMRWQQFTGRVMAKGVEDTAFYNYNRLISLNEVGGNPGRGAGFDGLAGFHAFAAQIRKDWPHTMNATSTHDTKRSEDVRARINVLSEIAPQWERLVRRWSKMNEPLRHQGVPDPNSELLIYQTLIGVWPLDDEELSTVAGRLRQYLEKAAREAKTHTSWITPDARYEQSLLDFAGAILENAPFREDLLRTQKRIAFYGFLNGLSQVVLKSTAPGAPDFYQGTELWDFSLVDPDNRRPVDYDSRSAMLRKMKAAAEKESLSIDTLLRRWHDSRIKMFVTWKMLDLRARHAALFRDGSYEPVDGGPNVVAFLRRHDDDAALIAVPRLVARLVKPGIFPIGEVWGDRSLAAGGHWRNLFTGANYAGEEIALRDLFADFPVAVLERSTPHTS
jgi:(1->4)-alpha-D-glucan 1-alpha-D-glucosylmutase